MVTKSQDQIIFATSYKLKNFVHLSNGNKIIKYQMDVNLH